MKRFEAIFFLLGGAMIAAVGFGLLALSALGGTGTVETIGYIVMFVGGVAAVISGVRGMDSTYKD